MAQLVTTKEKYGVSVAARIEPELAHKIAAKAEALGITMAKMVGMLIINGFSNSSEPLEDRSEKTEGLEDTILQLTTDVSDLQQELGWQKHIYSNATAEFIERISIDDEDTLDNIEIFNSILEEKKEDR